MELGSQVSNTVTSWIAVKDNKIDWSPKYIPHMRGLREVYRKSILWSTAVVLGCH